MLWVEVLFQPVFGKEGKIQQHFIIHTGITERKKWNAS
jgi:hypothetical protein